jgi:hypothetical protein
MLAQDAAEVNGGWSAVAGSATTGLRLGGAAGEDAGKAAASSSTKKAFFGDSSDENKPRPGAWLLEQRAKAAAEAGSQNGEVMPEHAGAGGSPLEQRQAAFEAERNKVRSLWQL